MLVKFSNGNATNNNRKKPIIDVFGYTILRNKAPRWHKNLQCLCLNFHGRVIVASIKKFQLFAIMDPSHLGGKEDKEIVLL